MLSEDGLCRYLYCPGEEHGDQRRRATNINWSKNTHRLDQIVEGLNNLVLYYLKKLEQNDVTLALLSSELQEQAIQFENIAL